MLLARLKKILSRHRKNPLISRLDRHMVGLHEAIENRNYAFHENGEMHVLEKLKSLLDAQVIFDVGANVGEWTQSASSVFPNSKIFSFEIVPETFQKLQACCGSLPNVKLTNEGLSDASGEIDVYFSPDWSAVASCVRNFAEDFHGYSPDSVKAKVITGDAYCSTHGIEHIDFLKIDVEGFDGKVLKGLSGMLKAGRIKVIQFEYGYVSIATKFLLRDFYELLRPLDMVIGKIYPNYVDFRDYQYQHEDFLGPNFLAVHASQKNLIEELGK
jgi:FkbM family methyltransferase